MTAVVTIRISLFRWVQDAVISLTGAVTISFMPLESVEKAI